MKYLCQICSNSRDNTGYPCCEKMFGWGGEFQYFQCANCGCLQIAEVPADLGRYYPPNYYSFHLQPVPQHGFKAWLAAQRDFSIATGRYLLAGRLIDAVFPGHPDLACLKAVAVEKQKHILDVGCGRGQLLSVLHRAGFSHLYGIDPFLAADFEVVPGLTIRKISLEDVRQDFDLIMLHHVFEHVESGIKTLRACREHLKPKGKVLVRIPTAESDAWDQYRENWVQLDAPRHLFLHTRKSMEMLARDAGLEIEQWWCDSSAFQFWGSELYKKGYSLYSSDGRPLDPHEHFTKAEMKDFSNRAKIANGQGRGDAVVIVLSVAEGQQNP